MDRIESIPLGIVVERRDSSHPWQDYNWLPVAVIPGAPPMDPAGPWKTLNRGDGWERYLAGTLTLEIYRTDTAAYLDCLSGDPPSVYVVLREDLDGDHEVVPFVATVSSYEAQDYLDGEDVVEPVPMPEAIAAWVRAFVNTHHVDEPFKKRKRKRYKDQELIFGKPPPVARKNRHES